MLQNFTKLHKYFIPIITKVHIFKAVPPRVRHTKSDSTAASHSHSSGNSRSAQEPLALRGVTAVPVHGVNI